MRCREKKRKAERRAQKGKKGLEQNKNEKQSRR